jgi:hypothetical protein
MNLKKVLHLKKFYNLWCNKFLYYALFMKKRVNSASDSCEVLDQYEIKINLKNWRHTALYHFLTISMNVMHPSYVLNVEKYSFYSKTPKKEAVRFFEILISFYSTTRHYIPEKCRRILHRNSREELQYQRSKFAKFVNYICECKIS